MQMKSYYSFVTSFMHLFFEIHIDMRSCLYFILCTVCYIVFHQMNILNFLYSIVDGGFFSQLVTIGNNVARNILAAY